MLDSISPSTAGQSEHSKARSWLASQVIGSAAVHVLVLGLAIFVCYFGLWNAYFITDDYWMLGWVRHHTSLGDAILAQFGYGVRFLLDAVLWTRVQLFDLNASPYYWISLLQHAAVALIVYWLARFWTQRRSVAFLTALLFSTTFAHYEVVTWITGSEYSLAAILYLSTLAFFGLYLQRRAIKWYIGALIAFVSLLIFLELSLSLPLMLIAYHLTLGRAHESGRPIGRREIRLHVPFWVLFAGYLLVQFGFVQSGSSEAVVAGASYGPGLHILPNFLKLVYLIVPDVHYGVLSAAIGQTGVQIVHVITGALAIAATAVAVVGIWKGTALVRFGLALIYLPFLPYTLWDSGFAGAIRYRYLPAIGFALLVALLLVHAHEKLRSRGGIARRWIVPAAVAALVAVNVFVVQIWVRRHVDNSALRQAFVTELAAGYQHVEAGAQIFIEVPEQKYQDLKEACTLIFDRPVQCNAFLYGEVSSADVADASSARPVYWLRSTESGIEQLYPPATEAH
jgi:hypothetical protein